MAQQTQQTVNSSRGFQVMSVGPSSPREEEDLQASVPKLEESTTDQNKSESDWGPPQLDRAELYDEQRIEQVFCENEECNPQRPTHRHFTEECKRHKFCVADEIPLKEPREMQILQPKPMNFQNLLHHMPPEFDKEWKERLVSNHVGSSGPLFKGTQLKINEESLGRWIAQIGPLDLDNFPVSATYLPEEQKALWAVLKEFPHTKIVRGSNNDKDKDKKIAPKPKTEEQLLKQGTQKASQQVVSNASKSSLGTINDSKKKGPASNLEKYKRAIDRSTRVPWNKTRYKVQPATQNLKSYSLVTEQRQRAQREAEKLAKKEHTSEKKQRSAGPQSKKIETDEQIEARQSNIHPSSWVKRRLKSNGLAFMDRALLQKTAYHAEKNFKKQKLESYEKALQDKHAQTVQKIKMKEDEKIERAQHLEQKTAKTAFEMRLQFALKKRVDKMDQRTNQDGAQDKVDSVFKPNVKRLSDYQKKRESDTMMTIVNDNFRTRSGQFTLQGDNAQEYFSPHQKVRKPRLMSAVNNKFAKEAIITSPLGCEKETRHQRVSSAKQRVPIIASKRLSQVEGGQTTMDTSNAKITTTDASNRFLHTKVKVRDFLSNETRDDQKVKTRALSLSNDINSEQHQPINSERLMSTFTPQRTFADTIECLKDKTDRSELVNRIASHVRVHKPSIHTNRNETVGSMESGYTNKLHSYHLGRRLSTKGVSERKNNIVLSPAQKQLRQDRQYQEDLQKTFKLSQVSPRQEEVTIKEQTPQNSKSSRRETDFQKAQSTRLKSVTGQFMQKLKFRKEESITSSESESDFAKQHPIEVPIRKTIGVGADATGPKLKKIKDKIIAYMNAQVEDEIVPEIRPLSVQIPKFELTKEEMKAKIQDITDPKFYLQQGLREEEAGLVRFAYANMFYEKGLRFNPNSLILIYNLARNYMILCQFKLSIIWFEFGLKFKPRWVNGLVGLALAYFELGYYSRAVVCIKVAHDNLALTKNDRPDGKLVLKDRTPSEMREEREKQKMKNSTLQMCHFTPDEIKLMQAVMSRAYADFTTAANQYKHLMPQMLLNETQNFSYILVNSFTLLLQDDRKLMMDSFAEIKRYFSLLHDENETVQNRTEEELLISHYSLKTDSARLTLLRSIAPGQFRNPTAGESLLLDWGKYKQTITKLLSVRLFFRRFTKQQLFERLQQTKIQAFTRDDIIFLNGRVGVVVSGSAFVKNHPGDNLCTPRILLKATEGSILGFSEGENCGGITVDPLSWIITHGKQTEILWFTKQHFKKLWDLQKQDSERLFYLKALDANPIFRCMSTITKFQLVYEAMYEEDYYPGELICNMDQRSPLNEATIEFYKDRKSSFAETIQARIRAQQDGPNANYQKSEASVNKNRSKNNASKASQATSNGGSCSIKNKKSKTQINSKTRPLDITLSNFSDDGSDEEIEFFNDLQNQKADQVNESTAKVARIGDKQFTASVLKQISRNKSFQFASHKSMINDVQRIADAQMQLQSVAQSNKLQPVRDFLATRKSSTERNLYQLSDLSPTKQGSGYEQKKRLSILSTITKEEAYEELQKYREEHEKENLIRKKKQTSAQRLQALQIVRAQMSQKFSEALDEDLKFLKQRCQIQKMFSKVVTEGMKSGVFQSLTKVFQKKILQKVKTQKESQDYDSQEVDLLEEALKELVEVRLNISKKFIESSAMSFIVEGEAVIYNKSEGGIIMRLNKGQTFGESFLTRRVSNLTVGHCMAGLQPIKILQFKYEDLDSVLTFPELAKIQALNQSVEVTNFLEKVGKKKNLQMERLLRY